MPKPSKSAAPDSGGIAKDGAETPSNGVNATPHWFADAMLSCLTQTAPPGRSEEPTAKAIAVGCSGGPDSMTLTMLLRDWCATRSIRLTALIVDHGLRPESAEEAARVAGWLDERGVDAVVLTHRGERPGSNIQAEARQMRYDLMRDWCAAEGVTLLAVAHHLEDQAETFLLRLARGSGVDGLAAMAPVSKISVVPPIALIRPLLDIPRSTLHAALRAGDWPFVDDPSNRDPRHARVRMRNLAQLLTQEGLDPQRLARTARNMRRARQALEAVVDQFLADHIRLHPYGFAGIGKQDFSKADEELALRIMTRLLHLVSGGDYPYRLDRLEDLVAGLRSETPPSPRTLGGCRIEVRAGSILVFREVSAIGPAAMAQKVLFWDRRFNLELGGDLVGITVRALGADGVRLARAAGLSGAGFEDVPGPARAALPGLWRDDVLVAIPNQEGGDGGVAIPDQAAEIAPNGDGPWFQKAVFAARASFQERV